MKRMSITCILAFLLLLTGCSIIEMDNPPVVTVDNQVNTQDIEAGNAVENTGDADEWRYSRKDISEPKEISGHAKCSNIRSIRTTAYNGRRSSRKDVIFDTLQEIGLRADLTIDSDTSTMYMSVFADEDLNFDSAISINLPIKKTDNTDEKFVESDAIKMRPEVELDLVEISQKFDGWDFIPSYHSGIKYHMDNSEIDVEDYALNFIASASKYSNISINSGDYLFSCEIKTEHPIVCLVNETDDSKYDEHGKYVTITKIVDGEAYSTDKTMIPIINKDLEIEICGTKIVIPIVNGCIDKQYYSSESPYNLTGEYDKIEKKDTWDFISSDEAEVVTKVMGDTAFKVSTDHGPLHTGDIGFDQYGDEYLMNENKIVTNLMMDPHLEADSETHIVSLVIDFYATEDMNLQSAFELYVGIYNISMGFISRLNSDNWELLKKGEAFRNVEVLCDENAKCICGYLCNSKYGDISVKAGEYLFSINNTSGCTVSAMSFDGEESTYESPWYMIDGKIVEPVGNNGSTIPIIPINEVIEISPMGYKVCYIIQDGIVTQYKVEKEKK